MIDPRRTYAKAAPEIALFATDDEASAALRAFRWVSLRNWRFWIGVLLLISAVPVGILMLQNVIFPAIRQHAAPWMLGAIIGFFFGGTIMLWWSYAVKRPLRRHLRETLVAAGVPVCLPCGYDLRGLDEPRCPECGAPFDPRLVKTPDSTPSVSDGL